MSNEIFDFIIIIILNCTYIQKFSAQLNKSILKNSTLFHRQTVPDEAGQPAPTYLLKIMLMYEKNTII